MYAFFLIQSTLIEVGPGDGSMVATGGGGRLPGCVGGRESDRKLSETCTEKHGAQGCALQGLIGWRGLREFLRALLVGFS